MMAHPQRLMKIVQSLLFVMLTTANATAGGIAFTCAAGEAGTKLSLSFNADVLSVTDDKGASSVPASIQGDPEGIFTLYGSGPMEVLMPDAAALDACLSAKLKAQGVTADDKDMLAYDSSACRAMLIANGAIQQAQAQLTLTSIDKGKATLFVQHQYLTPSAVTGKPLQLDEFPTRTCDVAPAP